MDLIAVLILVESEFMVNNSLERFITIYVEDIYISILII